MASTLIDKIFVRKWKDSDFNDAVVLNRESESYIGLTSENGDWGKDMEGITENSLNKNGDFLLGFLNEKLVVMGGYKRLSSTEAEVKRMRVTPTLQGNGIGRWFLKQLEMRMLNSGVTSVIVSTLSVQTGALRLYGSSGYKEIGRKVLDSGKLHEKIKLNDI